jgi:hypothetical protein
MPLHEEQQDAGRARVAGHQERDLVLRQRRVGGDAHDRVAPAQ